MECEHCRCLRRASAKDGLENPLITPSNPDLTDMGPWTVEQGINREKEPIVTMDRLAIPRMVNPSLLMPTDFIHINICGTWYQPLRSTLARFPTTLLADSRRMKRHYVEFMKAYYFDRHRECFDSILYYYQSGGDLIRPTSVPMDLFIKEVKFFDIPKEDLLCLETREGYVPRDEDDGPLEEDLPKNPYQRRVWQFIEHPESSAWARSIAIFSMLVIVVSITSFCLETVPKYHDAIYGRNGPHPHEHDDEDVVNNSTVNATQGLYAALNKNSVLSGEPKAVAAVLKMIEMISIAWFTLEYLVRLASSPFKWKFIKSIMNLIDLAAILPFYITLAVSQEKGSPLAIIRVARLLRVFRVFKLSRHSKGLQVLGSALKASINELAMIVFLLAFGIIVFASAIYYAEYDQRAVTTFSSIPNTFWYVLVTMTTVGYGDHIPQSLLGKLLGGGAAIAGVLTVAMVVPVVDSNFDFFYKRDRLQEEQAHLVNAPSRSPSMLPDGDASREASVIMEPNGDVHLKPNF